MACRRIEDERSAAGNADSGAWIASRHPVVDDREYVKGMIPHHSMATLTSERADLDDVRVCRLADGIIRAQREETDEMDWH